MSRKNRDLATLGMPKTGPNGKPYQVLAVLLDGIAEVISER
jgi:hypothetical protein